MQSPPGFALLAVGLYLWAPSVAASQATIPVRELSAPDKRSTEAFGTILGVRQMPANVIMVNDPERRRVVLLDSSWSKTTTVFDSSESSRNPYGPGVLQLIPYVADSTLRIDRATNAFLVLDAAGDAARGMAAIHPSDFWFMNSSASYTDRVGNLLYRGQPKRVKVMSAATHTSMTRQADSSPLLRSDFESRSIDTIANLRTIRAAEMSYQTDGEGGVAKHISPPEPLVGVDDWAVRSDGTIAIVRGGDYHVEIIQSDGTRLVSRRLPFDWKRVSETEKATLIDSATRATLKLFEPERDSRVAPGGGSEGSSLPVSANRGVATDREAPPRNTSPTIVPSTVAAIVDLPKPEELADYYPAMRPGAVRPDCDGNLWILPTTSAQSKNGELVYDVVNNHGELFERVRIPAGRAVAGFGRNGVVYLMVKEADGWYLERTTVLHSSRNRP